MSAIIPKGQAQHVARMHAKRPLVLGVDLQDAREEIFVRMVCDGLTLGIAYVRAGFKSKDNNAPAKLFALPRIQERANAILEARRTTGVVTLSEVTDMLQRVFAGAHSEGEYSAAHNAAFSLARLYGHVTDRATLEVIRRPSRDPDAPSEQALEAWALSLPVVGSGPGPDPADLASIGPPPDAPASLLGHGPQGPGPDKPNDINGLAGIEPSELSSEPAGAGPSQAELFNDINWLRPEARGRPENGAPSEPVTGTPYASGGSELLGPTSGSEKGAPLQEKQVPVPTGGYPPIEDLF